MPTQQWAFLFGEYACELVFAPKLMQKCLVLPLSIFYTHSKCRHYDSATYSCSGNGLFGEKLNGIFICIEKRLVVQKKQLVMCINPCNQKLFGIFCSGQ